MECNMNAPIVTTTNTIGSTIVKIKASVPSNNSSSNTPITKPIKPTIKDINTDVLIFFI